MDTPLAFELLHHAIALRALARLLVADHDVDDLCQDVALQTLQTPPPDPTGLRAFLRTVARRVARNHHREWARRRRREDDTAAAAAAAGRGDLPSPADVAAQQEQVQRVVAALLDLPQPYRDVLFGRFFHDATPSALALQRNVPLPTVKSQLQRGLAMLRERLDATERPDWRGVLVAAVGLEPGAMATTATTTSAAFALVLCFGLLLAVLGGWAVWSRPWSVPPATTSAAQSTGAATTTARDAPLALPAERAQRDSAPEPRAMPAPAPRRWLRGRCVDTHGRPVAGVTVELGTDADEEALFHWLRDHAPPPLAPVRLTTTADGAFAFAVEPLPVLDFELAWRHPDFVAMEGRWYTFEDGSDRDLGDIKLPRGVVVTGRLVDRAGVPQPGQMVDLLRRENTEDFWPCDGDCGARTRADGTFEFPAPLAPGHYEVLLHERRIVTPHTVDLAPAPAAQPLEIVVEPVTVPMSMDGVAIDEQHNAIAGVELYIVRGIRVGTTDAAGRFHLSRPPRTADTVTLDAQCFGYERLDRQGPFTWGRTDVRLVLRSGVPIEVHVVAAATAKPLPEVYVDLEPAGDDRHSRARARVYGPFPGGVITWPRVARGLYRLRVVPRDEGLCTFEREILVDDGTQRIDIALERAVPPNLASVHVRFLDGHPASGSEIEVLAAGAAPANAEPAWTQCDRAVTDRDGTAKVRLPNAPHLQLRVAGPGHVPLRANATPDATDPVLIVCRGARVSGHVVPPDFAERYAAHTGVGARAAVPRLRALPVDARALAAHQPPTPPVTIRGDGGFDLGDLAPGEWQIELGWDCPDNEPPFPLMPVALNRLLVGDQPQLVELDLSPHAACHLRALVRRNGEPLADAEVIRVYLGLGAPDAEDWATVRTDARGFLDCALRPGRVRVEMIEDTRGYLGVSDEVIALRPGATIDAEFTLRAGALHLRLQRPDGTPARGIRPFFWCAEAVDSLHNPLSSDEQGRVEVLLAPGTYVIHLGEGANRRNIGTVTIAAGETADMALVVPADAR